MIILKILFWFVVGILCLGTMITINMWIVQKYLDKKTQYNNRDITKENPNIQFIMLFFTFVLIFRKEYLRYKREVSFYTERLEKYKRLNRCKSNTIYKGDVNLYGDKIKDIERYLKVRKIQHKSKIRNR